MFINGSHLFIYILTYAFILNNKTKAKYITYKLFIRTKNVGMIKRKPKGKFLNLLVFYKIKYRN